MTSFEKSKNGYLAMRLYILMPMEVVDRLSNDMKVKNTKLCEIITENNQDWVNRVLRENESRTLSPNDLIHDFIGLASNDEHFLPRL
jgi:hypothetical protein